MYLQMYPVIAMTLYKIISLGIGFALCYLGYRLFMAGIWGESGDVEGSFGDNKVIVKKAAPGTFFALFGAIVIGLTILQGLNFNGKVTNIQDKPPVEEPPIMPD